MTQDRQVPDGSVPEDRQHSFNWKHGFCGAADSNGDPPPTALASNGILLFQTNAAKEEAVQQRHIRQNLLAWLQPFWTNRIWCGLICATCVLFLVVEILWFHHIVSPQAWSIFRSTQVLSLTIASMMLTSIKKVFISVSQLSVNFKQQLHSLWQ